MKKKETHHMGKSTGYELINGEYHIASVYTEQFHAMSLKKKGIADVINMVTSHFAEDLEQLNEATHKLWIEIGEDLDFEPKEDWIYSSGVIKRNPNKIYQGQKEGK